MSGGQHEIPPERVWLPVWDLPSALEALEFLIDYILRFDGTPFPSDHDEV